MKNSPPLSSQQVIDFKGYLSCNQNQKKDRLPAIKKSATYFATYSPLRYPGGKSFLKELLLHIIRINAPIDTYIEPFSGGAGAALWLLFNNAVKKLILNDKDELIFKFWKSILEEHKAFIRKMQTTPITVEEWKRQKSIIKYNNKGIKITDLDLGFATFYLNRCNRSGIFDAGPIGGQNQRGAWKIDARFDKANLIKKIELIASFKNRIEVHNFDALYFLKHRLENSQLRNKKTIIYLDPPYYEKGPLLYRYYFDANDHINLRNYLKNKLRAKWILSYDDVPFINSLYRGTRKNDISVNHFAHKAKVGKELIIISDNCINQEESRTTDLNFQITK